MNGNLNSVTFKRNVTPHCLARMLKHTIYSTRFLNNLFRQIIRVSSESYHVVKGESVSLECFAEGNPRPVITWSRKGGLLPNGALSLEVRCTTMNNSNMVTTNFQLDTNKVLLFI